MPICAVAMKNVVVAPAASATPKMAEIGKICMELSGRNTSAAATAVAAFRAACSILRVVEFVVGPTASRLTDELAAREKKIFF